MSQFSHEHPELAVKGVTYLDFHSDLADLEKLAEIDGPAVGRCLACGQFTKGGAVMCGDCGLDEDRRNAGQ